VTCGSGTSLLDTRRSVDWAVWPGAPGLASRHGPMRPKRVRSAAFVGKTNRRYPTVVGPMRKVCRGKVASRISSASTKRRCSGVFFACSPQWRRRRATARYGAHRRSGGFSRNFGRVSESLGLLSPPGAGVHLVHDRRTKDSTKSTTEWMRRRSHAVAAITNRERSSREQPYSSRRASKDDDGRATTKPRGTPRRGQCACFAMDGGLFAANAGHAPKQLKVTAAVDISKVGEGFAITSARARARGESMASATIIPALTEARRPLPGLEGAVSHSHSLT